MIEKINNSIQISCDDEVCALTVKNPSGVANLERFDAIKLRNYLNKFINGDFEKEEE